MKFSFIMLIGMSFLGVSCGNSNDEQDKCLGVQNPCQQIDDTKCSADLKQVMNCSMNLDGCLVWTPGDSCDGNQTCSAGQCVCVNLCDDPAQGRCSGDKLQTCTEDVDGCLVWSTSTDCAVENKHCDDSADVAVCTPDCTNKCDSAGHLRCSGDVIQTCTADDSGCLDWQDTSDCSAENKHCDDSADGPICVDACTNECDTVDDLRCNLFTIQRCELGLDNCRYWRDSQDCTENDEFCQDPQDGTAHCTTCEPPNLGCQPGERCTMSTFGVFFCLPEGDVPENGDCSAADCQAGLICLDGTCVAFCQNASECSSAYQHCVWAWPELGTPWGVCRPGCDPILQTGCDGNEESACYYSDPEAGTTECWMPGSLQEGEDCSDMTQFCAPGLDCVLEPNSDPYEYYCRAYCDPQHPCPQGKSCQITSHMVQLPVCL